jgi:hypothetical protein
MNTRYTIGQSASPPNQYTRLKRKGYNLNLITPYTKDTYKVMMTPAYFQKKPPKPLRYYQQSV